MQFADRATFEAAAGAVTVQDFEGFAPQVDAFENVAFDFGDFSAFNGTNAFSGGDIANLVANPSFGDSNLIFGATFIGDAFFRLTFDSPIVAIGFDGGELADQRSDEVLFDNAAGDVIPIFDPIDQVRFSPDGGGDGDGFAVDNVTYAASVPEPFPLALGALAAAAATLGRRKAPARA